MSDLNELDNLDVDVDVAPPDQYPDSTAATLPLRGTYGVVIKSVEPTRDFTTKQVDGRGFELTLETIETPDQRPYTMRFVRIWATTFERNGVKVSQLGDLIRAIDDQVVWHGLSQAGAILQKAMDLQTPIAVRLDWEGFDQDYFKAEGGNAMPRKSDEAKALRKAATIKGMRNFPQYPDGSYNPEAIGKSGNKVPARLVVTNYISSSKRK